MKTPQQTWNKLKKLWPEYGYFSDDPTKMSQAEVSSIECHSLDDDDIKDNYTVNKLGKRACREFLAVIPKEEYSVLNLGDYYQVYSDYSAYIGAEDVNNPFICPDIREYFDNKFKPRIPLDEMGDDDCTIELAHFLGYHLESEQDNDGKIYFKVVKNG